MERFFVFIRTGYLRQIEFGQQRSDFEFHSAILPQALLASIPFKIPCKISSLNTSYTFMSSRSVLKARVIQTFVL